MKNWREMVAYHMTNVAAEAEEVKRLIAVGDIGAIPNRIYSLECCLQSAQFAFDDRCYDGKGNRIPE